MWAEAPRILAVRVRPNIGSVKASMAPMRPKVLLLAKISTSVTPAGSGACVTSTEALPSSEKKPERIPIKERLVALADILHHQTDQLTMMPLFYQATANILGDVHLRNGNGLAMWDAHLWDLGS